MEGIDTEVYRNRIYLLLDIVFKGHMTSSPQVKKTCYI